MTKPTKENLANVSSIIAIALCAVWLVGIWTTEPNAWLAELAGKLVLPFVLISVGLRIAAKKE